MNKINIVLHAKEEPGSRIEGKDKDNDPMKQRLLKQASRGSNPLSYAALRTTYCPHISPRVITCIKSTLRSL